jgi:hypothetical protein
MHMPQNFTWYLPSVYGDIKLEKITDKSTRLTLVGLSPTEKEAVKALFARAVKPGAFKKAWTSETALREIHLDSLREQTVALDAPISQVQDFLQKKLKPHRKQVSVVRFASGRLEELSEATLQVIDGSGEEVPAMAVEAQPTPPVEKEEKPKPKKEDKPAVAATVAQPALGCPVPEFDDVEIRATRVLKAFLTPEQIEDFNRRQQFVAVGADTGHRYLLTSRNSKHAFEQASFRSLYDMDERQALCVHDWEVPAAEELLGLYLHVSLPGLEGFVRSMPDRDGVLHR